MIAIVWLLGVLFAGAASLGILFADHLHEQEKEADKRALYAATGGFTRNDVHKQFHFARACEKQYTQTAVAVFLSNTILDADPEDIAVISLEHERFLSDLASVRMDEITDPRPSMTDQSFESADASAAINRMFQMILVRRALVGFGVRNVQDLIRIRNERWIDVSLDV